MCNTPKHRAYYLHEIARYPRLSIVHKGDLTAEIYLKVRKGPSNN